MVVKSSTVDPEELDLAYLALFVGQRVNELVVNRMKKEGAAHVRQSHGYVIQHLMERERSITELARRMEVTQQAASKSVAELIRLRMAEAAPSQDKRAKTIQLTRRGRAVVEKAREVRAKIDRDLARELGRKDYERVKRGLLACLKELGGVARVKARRVKEPG